MITTDFNQFTCGVDGSTDWSTGIPCSALKNANSIMIHMFGNGETTLLSNGTSHLSFFYPVGRMEIVCSAAPQFVLTGTDHTECCYDFYWLIELLPGKKNHSNLPLIELSSMIPFRWSPQNSMLIAVQILSFAWTRRLQSLLLIRALSTLVQIEYFGWSQKSAIVL